MARVNECNVPCRMAGCERAYESTIKVDSRFDVGKFQSREIFLRDALLLFSAAPDFRSCSFTVS